MGLGTVETKVRRGPGRPRHPPETRCTHDVRILLPDPLHEGVVEAARRAGKKVAPWIRDLLVAAVGQR